MEMIDCACGCGQQRPLYDKKGRKCRYIQGHVNKEKSLAQIRAARANINAARPKQPWNKGKTYTHASKTVYANKGAWNKAMRRLFADRCMRCGWDESSC